MDDNDLPENLLEAVRHFSDENVCREFLVSIRWPDGVTCPREGCGSDKVSFYATRGVWRCAGCKKQFSVKVGTIFEDSPIPLTKWLPAVWMLTAAKQGVSSYQMARALGITQKSAWHMDHRIRLAMRTDSFLAPLTGEIEADETYFGGKERNKHKSKRQRQGGGIKGKAPVMGLLERGGDVRAKLLPNNSKAQLHGMVRRNVSPGSTLYTDALMSYRGLRSEYDHAWVDHAEKYVSGRISTNGLEGFWSLLKRSVNGTYHSIEPAHMDHYLAEFTRRYNTRKMSDQARFIAAMAMTIGRRLTYKDLVGESA